MRLLVLKQLIESDSALSLSELEHGFEKADKVTLYRTLKTFEEKKLVHSIDDGSGALKYALCEEGCECAPKDQHIHFHCESCEETFCLVQSKIPSIKIPSSFKVKSANMVFKGICANCSD
jgi:Fur family ferric uptake transcriptional regulator